MKIVRIARTDQVMNRNATIIKSQYNIPCKTRQPAPQKNKQIHMVPVFQNNENKAVYDF
jgi:hypothetical protein